MQGFDPINSNIYTKVSQVTDINTKFSLDNKDNISAFVTKNLTCHGASSCTTTNKLNPCYLVYKYNISKTNNLVTMY